MNIPTLWADLLARIQTLVPTAVLAGGALRDLDNGRPVKDLDVFVPAGTCMFEMEARVYATHRGISAICNGDYIDSACEVERTTTFAGRFDFDTLETPPDLNIICLRTGCDVQLIADRVDFGLCQISWNGRYLYHSAEYEVDKANHTLTLTRVDSADGFERSMKRYERLAQKYVGWKLVIPERFLSFMRAA